MRSDTEPDIIENSDDLPEPDTDDGDKAEAPEPDEPDNDTS